MEQQGDNGRGGGDMNKHQPQDLEMQQGDEQVQVQVQPQQPQQQPQPQKCPRCESLNTKFCYYNNYSLSQPRYFCKTCRRYWTQGGTLRNVPVGGGCRKGKRAKSSSSSTDNYSSSRSMQPQPQLSPQEVVQTQPNLTTVVRAKDPSSAVASPSPAVAPSISPFYQGGGRYLSSLAAIHSLNASQSHPFDQSLKVGVDVVGSSSNLGLLSGFNVASLASQRQIRPLQFYQMGSREREVESLYTPEQGLIPSSMDHRANSSALSHCDWSQSFISNANNRASDASLWSTISSTSISSDTRRNTTAGSSSLIPNQWPDLPGYGLPP